MALCGVTERSEATWRHLISSAGLILENVHMSKDCISESVLEATRVKDLRQRMNYKPTGLFYGSIIEDISKIVRLTPSYRHIKD